MIALNVIVYGPPTDGVPASTPVAGVNVTPPGSPVAESVGAGRPVAVTTNVFAPAVENVALFALVNTGALFRVKVKLAVIAASVGTIDAPHVASAATAAIDTLFKLITYEPLVALACGARLNVASS